MSVRFRLTLGFLLVAALVAATGFSGFRSFNDVRQKSDLGKRLDDLLTAVTEQGSLILSAPTTTDLDTLDRVESRVEAMHQDINVLMNDLAGEPKLAENKDFQQFLFVVRSNVPLRESLFQFIRERLTRQDLFADTPQVEADLQYQIDKSLMEQNIPKLTRGIGEVKYHSKEAIYQYQDEPHFNQWRQSIAALMEDLGQQSSGLPPEQARRLHHQLDVYLQTASILQRITLENNAVQARENLILEAAKANEIKLRAIRSRVSEQIFSEIEASASYSRNVLIVTVFTTVIVAVTIGLLIARSVSIPIGKLRSAVVALGQGESSSRVQVSGKDEITELAKAYNEMAYNLVASTVSKKYMDNIMSSMADALLVVGANGRIKSANQSACGMLEYGEYEIIGIPFDRIFIAPDASRNPTKDLIKQKSARGLEADSGVVLQFGVVD